MEILNAGGNAFDAAVAVTGALSVVAPKNCGLGGGGFWLLHRARDGFETLVDGGETAPQAATRDMYLDAHGNVLPNLSLNGPLSAAIPGTPAALAHLAKKYGRLPLTRSLAPAIRLARDGFATDEFYRRAAELRTMALASAPGLLNDGKPPSPGFMLRQSELAAVLTTIAQHGATGFYQGAVAKRLVDGVRNAGGLWTIWPTTKLSSAHHCMVITAACASLSTAAILRWHGLGDHAQHFERLSVDHA